ncbi:hypothetical protein FXO38_25592 [Capsicum annuum]|uniref:F-box domain-containing protein n=1 Tax=Capsicum annuum TaxID=4072 RepID=A0A1U8GI38_CAPAN|nr:putative F-box protein At1g50870 [Capsicum annuum]KAF3633441.1 hypothetical protein FXO38_25592 [Capsicum annuum]PHT84444.1 hypothetical protein T459_12887 [Capsicum annuum]
METHQHFSCDIVWEISTYLPVKSLMRFKCVSKAWNTMMQCPNFARSHYARSHDRPSATRFLFQLKTNNKDHLKKSSLMDLSLQLDYFCYDGEMRICSNHCNGLVCLYIYKDTQVYLYNVTTREIKALPPYVNREIKIYPYVEHRSKRKWLPGFDRLFLGFDQVTGNYKLLLLSPHPAETKKAKILTLGVTNSCWRKIDLSNYADYSSCLSYRECIYLNGVLYLIWFDYVAYLDFGEEKIGYISLPPQAHSFERSSCMHAALWGQLAIRCCRYGKRGWPRMFGYDEANKVFIPLESGNGFQNDIYICLPGMERINDKTKEAHVLATTSVIDVPDALLLSSISLPCLISFVAENNIENRPTPDLVFRFVSRFVENIIPLNSLLVSM